LGDTDKAWIPPGIELPNFRRASIDILAKAWEHIGKVEGKYRVSLRWLFYRLLQDSTYKTKGDYKRWGVLCGKARKSFWEGWRPYTLADETREIIRRRGYFEDEDHFRGQAPDWIADDFEVPIDHTYQQRHYVIMVFEARAMTEQFEYYSKGIDLCPFGGDPSHDLKWRLAKHLEKVYDIYDGLPITVLYFGDCDRKGEQIPESALGDVRRWCTVPFEILHFGLTLEQALRLGVEPNPDKPDEYQWEALTDDAASQIIREGIMATGLNLDLIEECDQEGDRLTKVWRDKTRALIEKELKRKGRH
jgi:hypothetical protein